jgi:hypothetical protein
VRPDGELPDLLCGVVIKHDLRSLLPIPDRGPRPPSQTCRPGCIR